MSRRKWYEYQVKKGKLVYKKTGYLLDEYLEIKFDGLYSENFVNAIIEAFFNSESCRACSHTCEALFGVTISHESIRRIVIDLGQKEKNNEKERMRAVEKEQIIPDEQRDISVLFGEVDGINIKLQGKDKAKIIEKNIKRSEKNIKMKLDVKLK